MFFFWNLSRFALFVLWRSIQSQFKKDQPQFKMKENNCFEEGKIIEFVKARGSAVPLPPSGSHLPLLQVEVGAQVTLG